MNIIKKLILNIITIILLVTSCKKEKEEAPKSYWVFDGLTFKGFAETHPLGSAFDASERMTRYGISTGNFVSFNFSYNYMPKKTGIYAVKKNAIDTTQCTVTVSIIRDGRSIFFTSVNSTSQVTINVSPEGKLSSTFSNIALSYFATGETKTVSGSLEEQ